MFNFTLILINPNVQITLGFKDEDAAKIARSTIRAAQDIYLERREDTNITIKDDYNQRVDVAASNIAGMLIQDHKGNIERANDQNIDVARVNEDFMKRRNGDMELMRLFPGHNSVVPFTGRG